ncbi:hypothetical protein [Streptomyces acidicola]|uniref:Uncharacterized protein n=1 Tax=Streptomyces acidicola TaxID=2596892 RepID=A0A5N8WWY0_9ACTN|nr:hypothetical protein [Streptomyces acidicola]MPY51901.1 hypothetical protein [Streptomyces acidicola]
MARLYVRSGLDPDEPDVPVAVLLVDPEGTPGERAVARLGDYCHEVNGWACLLRTDGWAEQARDGGQLVVDVAVYPSALLAVGVDPADFTGRSVVDPEAVVILRAQTAAAPEASVRLSEGTVVFTTGLDIPLDELLATYDDWPMVLAPPPEEFYDNDDDDRCPEPQPEWTP